METESQDQKKSFLPAIIIVIGAAIAFSLWQGFDFSISSTDKVIKQSMPFLQSIVSTELACEGLLDSYLGEDIDSMRAEDAKLSGTVGKATDTIAIKIDEQNKILTFLTKASVSAGTSSGVPFRIISSTPKSITAVDLTEAYEVGRLNTFILNKENGLAIWTKTRDGFLGTDIPDSQSVLLICR